MRKFFAFSLLLFFNEIVFGQGFALENIPVTGLPTNLKIRSQGDITSGAVVGTLANNNFIAATSYGPGGQIVENGLSFGYYWYDVDIPSSTSPSSLGPYSAAGYPFLLPRCNKPVITVAANSVRLRTSPNASVTTNYIYLNSSAAFIWQNQKYVLVDSINQNGYLWYRIYAINECVNSSSISQPIAYCAAKDNTTLTRFLNIQQPYSTPLSPINLSTAVITTANSATITWNHNIDDADGYNVAVYQNGNLFSSTYVTDITGFNLSQTYTISGLNSSTQYSVLVQPITNTNCFTNYSNQVFFTTLGGCQTPTQQASNIYFTGNDGISTTVNWSNGNGTKRLVVMNSINSFSAPQDGIEYNTNISYQNAGEQPVYYGTGSSVYVNQLNPCNTYYFKVYEANCTGAQVKYLTSNSANNPVGITMQGSGIPVVNFSSSSFSVVMGNSLNFYDLSTNNPTSWNWIIEREQYNNTLQLYTTTSFKNPIITFNEPGCFKVTLQATNCAGTGTKSLPCYIYVLPNVNAVIPETVTRAQQYYQYKLGDPISPSSGATSFSMSDLEMKGLGHPFSIQRFYNSTNPNIGLFGKGWTSNIESYIDISNPNKWTVHHDDGHESYWSSYPNGVVRSYYPEYGDSMTYTYNSATSLLTITYINQDKSTSTFIGTGSILKINSKEDLYQNKIQYQYIGNNLLYVIVPGGRKYTVTINVNGRASLITDEVGRQLQTYFDNSGTYQDSSRIETSITRFGYANGLLDKVINPKGDIVFKNIYDGSGKVVNQKDGYDRPTSFEYNLPSTNQTTVTNPIGKKKVVTSDINGRTTNIKDEASYNVTSFLNSNGLLDSIKEQRGNVSKFKFDSKQNLIQTINAKGNGDSIIWNSVNRPTTIKDREGNTLNIQYNAQGSPIIIQKPYGYQSQIKYNVQGLDTLSIGSNGYELRKKYNSRGDIIEVTDFRGSWFYYYDLVGRLIAIKHPNIGYDSIFYNHFNLITKIKDPLGDAIQWGYNVNGNCISFTDKKGQTTTYDRNKIDNVIAVHLPDNKNTYYTRDSLEQIIKIEFADGNKRFLEYTDRQQLFRVTDSITGLLREYEYYENGALKSTKIFTGGKWINTLDANSNVTDITAPNGNKQSVLLNKNDITTTGIDARNKNTVYTLDSLSRPTQITDPLNLSVLNKFNKIDVVDSVKDANNITTKSITDLLGRPTNYFDGAESWALEYDAENNPTKTTKPDGLVIENKYNLRNEIDSIVVNGSTVHRFYKDKNGLLDSVQFENGNYSFKKNKVNIITEQKDHLGNIIKYGRDKRERIDTLNYPNAKRVIYEWINDFKCSVTDWNNKNYTLFYNPEGKLYGIFFPNENQTISTFNTSLEKTTHLNWGKINNQPPSYFQTNLLRFDAGFIAKDSGVKVLEPSVTIEPTGGTYINGDKIKNWGNYNYTNDKNGNVSKEINTTLGIANYITHNWQNLPINLRLDGDSIINHYDYYGARIKKVNITKNTTELFVIDRQITSWPVILQIRNADNSEKQSILYSPDGTPLMIDSLGTIKYYHFDVYGNTIALADDNGIITDTYASSSFGHYAKHIGNSTQPLQWQGQYNCTKEGKTNYAMGAGVRLYDAKSHRFWEKDPLGTSSLHTQTTNPYLFALNNPTKWSDPTGLEVAVNNTSYDAASLNFELQLGNYKRSLCPIAPVKYSYEMNVESSTSSNAANSFTMSKNGSKFSTTNNNNSFSVSKNSISSTTSISKFQNRSIKINFDLNKGVGYSTESKFGNTNVSQEHYLNIDNECLAKNYVNGGLLAYALIQGGQYIMATSSLTLPILVGSFSRVILPFVILPKDYLITSY